MSNVPLEAITQLVRLLTTDHTTRTKKATQFTLEEINLADLAVNEALKQIASYRRVYMMRDYRKRVKQKKGQPDATPRND